MKGGFLISVFLSLIACAYAQNQEGKDVWALMGPKDLTEHLQFMSKAWGSNFTVAEIKILKIQSETLVDKNQVGELKVLLIDQLRGDSKALGLQEKKVFRIYASYPSQEKKWKLQENEKIIVFLAPARVTGELNHNVTMFMQANKESLQRVREALEQINGGTMTQKLKTDLESIIRKYYPDASLKVEASVFSASARTMTYQIHSVGKDGRVSEKAHPRVGPKADGFDLVATVVQGPYQGAAGLPQTFRKPYWETYGDAILIDSGAGHIHVNFSYGVRTSKEFIKAVIQKLKEFESK